MDFIVGIKSKSIDEWLINQCESIWSQIVIRYKATLNRGEQFVEFAGLTPAALCRTISSNVSASLTQTSSGPNTCQRMWSNSSGSNAGVCKICYSNPINMVFVNCSHAGTCTECVKTHINTSTHMISDYDCPFCKQTVTNYIELSSTHPPHCQKCNSVVSYYGDCLHPISCTKCIKDMVSESEPNMIKCNICMSNHKVMKVHMM